MLCLCNSNLVPNFLLQVSQLNSLIFSWTIEIWFSKCCFADNFFLQCWHSNSLFASWTVSVCFLRAHFWEKLFSQSLHLNGFFFSWTELMCNLKFLAVARDFLQISHICSGGLMPKFCTVFFLPSAFLFLGATSSGTLDWEATVPALRFVARFGGWSSTSALALKVS